MATRDLLNTSLSDLVLEHPAAARVLRQRGLDYCCRGHRTLPEACAEAGIQIETLTTELASAPDAKHPPALDWTRAPMRELIGFILTRYHEPLKQELPDLLDCARKVEAVHHSRSDVPRGLTRHLEAMAQSLLEHLSKEENVLFPMILAGHGNLASMPVRVMLREHEDHAANLRRMRELTNDLRAPEDACVTWRSVYARLDALESDLFAHVHLENHVLFPRALRESDQ